MASSTENVKIGPCRIYFNSVDLGYTKGGVEVAVTTDTHKVMIDQFGESEVNEIITKRSVSVTVPLAETTLPNLVSIMPGATLITDGVDSNKKRVDVTNAIGQSLLDIAQELKLVPLENGVEVAGEAFIIPKAATAGALNFAYKHNDERVFNCSFMGYPDDANGNVLFKFGDATATA